MTLAIYGLKKCSTCQKALAWLDEHKIAYAFHDVKDAPPTQIQVEGWAKALGGWEKLINRAGYTWRGLPAASTEGLTEKTAAVLAVANPSLIRRPLIEYSDGSISVGFSDKVREKLKG